MRTETKLFGLLAGFFILVAMVYAWLTAAMNGAVERVGTVALVLSCVLCTLIGGFCLLVSRRIPPRPEDRGNAVPADAAGDVGFFSPHSYWPAAIGVGAGLAALGIAVWQLWLGIAGVLTVLFSSAAMIFEYYTGATRGEG